VCDAGCANPSFRSCAPRILPARPVPGVGAHGLLGRTGASREAQDLTNAISAPKPSDACAGAEDVCAQNGQGLLIHSCTGSASFRRVAPGQTGLAFRLSRTRPGAGCPRYFRSGTPRRSSLAAGLAAACLHYLGKQSRASIRSFGLTRTFKDNDVDETFQSFRNPPVCSVRNPIPVHCGPIFVSWPGAGHSRRLVILTGIFEARGRHAPRRMKAIAREAG